MLNNIEKTQYSRHLCLPEVGYAGQMKLKNARVLCIGAGGLGAPVLLYLAAAGVGTLGVVDDDCVDVSNLQRQVLFTRHDIGKSKAKIARQRLHAINDNIRVHAYETRLTKENALLLINQYDIVVDATDNFSSRYLINDVCHQLNKPFVYGSIFQFEGQCSVFHRDQTPCYRCLYPHIDDEFAPNCSEAGVIGVLPGLLGTIQANEALKLILNIGKPLKGRLLSLDALDMSVETFAIQSNPDCPICQGQQDYLDMEYGQGACAIDTVKSINYETYQNKIDMKEAFKLIDIRSQAEYETFNIGGDCIDYSNILAHTREWDKEQAIMVCCSVGVVSKQAVSLLNKAGFAEACSLEHGLLPLEESGRIS